MKVCPQCRSTDVPDTAGQCPFCLYRFEESKRPRQQKNTADASAAGKTPVSEGAADTSGKPESLSGTAPILPETEEEKYEQEILKKKSGQGKWIVLVIVTVIIVIIIKSCSRGEDRYEAGAETRADMSGETGAEEYTESAAESRDASLLLEQAAQAAENARTEYESGNYFDGAIPLCVEAINTYAAAAEENDMREEVREDIFGIYEIYTASVLGYCDNVKAQGAYASCYEQINSTLTDAVSLTEALAEKGYSVDGSSLYDYKEKLIPEYRDMFIEVINKVTENANWSRDEAWGYAEQAYAVQENGTPVLFDPEEPDDPLRMRYVYCLAWVTRKRCETGIEDGTITFAGAVQNMQEILEETDYNPMLLQDIITYGSYAGMNVEKYRDAYNAIVEEIRSAQRLTIGTDVDLNHFWYFNDLDGEDKYKVDAKNGTNAAVREWVRTNVPVILGE